jgi:twitching motility protein PilT
MLRIDGRLEPYESPALSHEDLASISARLLNEAAQETLDRVGDVTATISRENGIVRVHAQRAGGVALALRFLARRIPNFEELGLPRIVLDLSARPHGMLLVAGPTGSGKSTTLASLVAGIAAGGRRKIITIEDPIEYEIPNGASIVVQRQIGRDVSSFSAAIKGALRSDPDAIVVGEMRDCETMAAAMDAAETGHLVLATVHAGDAVQCVDRIVNAFSERGVDYERMRLAQTLLGIVVQRLVERATGAGRRAAAEILVATDAVRHMIRDGKQHQFRSAMESGRQFGMQTLRNHLEELAAAGEISRQIAESASA